MDLPQRPPAIVSIRPAMPQDAPAIAKVHVDSWAATYANVFPTKVFEEYSLPVRERMWQRTVLAARTQAEPRTEVLVAERAARLIGFVSLGPFREAQGVQGEPGRGELNAIYLDPASMRQGIGSQLFAAGREWLRAAGFSEMRLWVISGNPALAFYRAQGGTLVEEKTFEVHGVTLGERSLRFDLCV
jgi:GNAT superfamily N-acetyltransferase